ncbi:MAG: hypothetical protein KC420_19745 [Myxococcales bacterium]|nr:hypothetical protein [Myxococcales bacterium]MCB9702327.1 hypothetical protein [Myxococcales bacterium]
MVLLATATVDSVDALEDLAHHAPAQGDHAALLVTSYTSGDGGYRLHAADGPLDGWIETPADSVGRRLVVGEFDGAPRPDALILSSDLHGLVGADPWPPPLNLVFEDDAFIGELIAVGDLNEDGIDDLAYASGPLVLLLSNP